MLSHLSNIATSHEFKGKTLPIYFQSPPGGGLVSYRHENLKVLG